MFSTRSRDVMSPVTAAPSISRGGSRPGGSKAPSEIDVAVGRIAVGGSEAMDCVTVGPVAVGGSAAMDCVRGSGGVAPASG